MQPTTTSQPGLIQPVSAQPTGTLPMTNQPILENSMNPMTHDPMMQDPMMQPADVMLTSTDPIKSDFGKIKGLEVMTFKEAELERTLEGRTTFAAVGNLQVLYFANFDRFVLSLNNWKYPLLRRIPVVGSGPNMTGPVQYTLPTYQGYYTLRLNKIPHMEAVQNLETIFMNNGKFSYHGTENILKRDLSPDDRFRGQYEAIAEPYDGTQAQSLPDLDQPMEPMGPTGLSRKDRIKRGFSKIGFKLTKGLTTKGKHNLNHVQLRDIDSIKRTSEITVPLHLYPRREVERWISYSKEIANKSGYEPELPEGYELGTGSPMSMEAGRLRGYGSVDYGQGFVSDPFRSKVLSTGITTQRPENVHLYNSNTGTVGMASTHHPKTYTKPKMMDKIKAKLPGTHHYHGEKTDGNTYSTHATDTHPGLMDKMKTKIVGHDAFPHQGLLNPTAVMGNQSLHPQGPMTGTTGTYGSTPVYSGLPIYAPGQGTIIGPATGIISQGGQPLSGTTNPIISQGQQFVSGVSQPIMQTQGLVTDSRLQSNMASNIPTQHVDIMRGQEHLAHDQA